MSSCHWHSEQPLAANQAAGMYVHAGLVRMLVAYICWSHTYVHLCERCCILVFQLENTNCVCASVDLK